ncbi:hypothetical protein LTR78_009872 [Recurvomyces mirabilis]|uniref:Fe2OG dioxygenase domain-containing protein n=1 Tax=Recurvomyces mirabilis TaxID=574656 RepID=A0AAE0TN57_9PEZI|nr:hypothetical protein LTR78_009872 [Recurvomyces mirabilis]KAK5150547.1 hypothetical protein LTS14_010041 [Recurvomyces mirabilis]
MQDRHRVPGPPESIFYIPNFITKAEEAKILESIPPNKWIALSHRRLQAWPARLTATNTLITSSSASSLPSWLQDPVVSRIQALGVIQGSTHGDVNHCLINEYLPGQGIMPHEDGGAYWPVVATVSLGASVVLHVTAKIASGHMAEGEGESRKEGEGVEEESRNEGSWRILQEPRSLLVTFGAAYTETLHGIAEVEEDVGLREGTVANWNLLGDREGIVKAGGRNVRGTRVSLTLRDVRKVSKLGGKLFGKGRS